MFRAGRERQAGDKKPPPRQHGGDMQTAGGGETPNTNKGRAGVDASNILANEPWNIKESLEI